MKSILHAALAFSLAACAAAVSSTSSSGPGQTFQVAQASGGA